MTPFRVMTLALLCALSAAAVDLLHPLSDDFIELINKKQNLWKAGRNFPVNTPFEHIKKLMGVLRDDSFKKLPVRTHKADLIASLPKNFDPRYKWPNCPTLNEIRDQGSCGSCWALAAVEAMSDRVCTYSNGTRHFHFSAQDLLSCCLFGNHGCQSGRTRIAWEYWICYGIVSGGNYNSAQGCKPYQIPPCEHNVNGIRMPCSGSANTPKCVKTCINNYKVAYTSDKRYGKHIFSVKKHEDHIKAELYVNGPVEASITVYSDLICYKNGVYKHTEGFELGSHAVKIIGWGVEKGTKYWLIANSWNTDWGNNGFFKMLRGKNHCNIESFVVAGEPDI